MNPFLTFLGLMILLIGIVNTYQGPDFYLSKILTGVAIIIISFNLNDAPCVEEVK